MLDNNCGGFPSNLHCCVFRSLFTPTLIDRRIASEHQLIEEQKIQQLGQRQEQGHLVYHHLNRMLAVVVSLELIQ